MRVITSLLLAPLVALALSGDARAQQKVPPSQLKVQVVFSEFDGEKKIASLPYALTAVAGGEDENAVYTASLRLGISVPILIQTKEGSPQTQYQDMGTNIDCRIKRYDNGQFRITFNVERSSVYSPESAGGHEVAPPVSQDTPILRKYRSSFEMILRDGQPAQGPVATDPQSGRVLKTDVTLTVVH